MQFRHIYKSALLMFFMLLLSGCAKKEQVPVRVDLHKGWTFKNAQDTMWFSASVPGNIHSDLLEHNRISHPFVGNNEEDLQWISERNWEYKNAFELPDHILKKEHIELHFEGLDTYADVYLNGQLILSAANAFLEYTLDVKHIASKTNELKVLFKPTSSVEEKASAALGYSLPEEPRVFTRKAQFQYGWDWGPKLNGIGISKDISIDAWDNYKIENIYIKNNSALPSSAAVERMFLVGKDVWNPKHAHLNDEHFQMLIFLKD